VQKSGTVRAEVGVRRGWGGGTERGERGRGRAEEQGGIAPVTNCEQGCHAVRVAGTVWRPDQAAGPD
jgi:hypothetical protein